MIDYKSIKKASDYIKNKTKINKYDIAVIFGSGLSPEENDFRGIKIPYKSITNFPVSTVKGHSGELLSFSIEHKKILFFLGRVHYFEGFTPAQVSFPVRIMKELGVKKLIITNASGGLNKKYKAGDLMIIKDQINLTGNNPLIGPNINEQGTRFPDMFSPYSIRLSNLLKKLTKAKLKEGIYIGVSGPNYETSAEINYLRKIGGDAVGMSTIFETITANHCEIENSWHKLYFKYAFS